MTNEEKAKYEAGAYRRRLECDTTLCNDDLNAASIEVYNRCLKTAEWKDQRFKEYLEKRKHDFGIDYIVNPVELLDEIINELFGE